MIRVITQETCLINFLRPWPRSGPSCPGGGKKRNRRDLFFLLNVFDGSPAIFNQDFETINQRLSAIEKTPTLNAANLNNCQTHLSAKFPIFKERTDETNRARTGTSIFLLLVVISQMIFIGATNFIGKLSFDVALFTQQAFIHMKSVHGG